MLQGETGKGGRIDEHHLLHTINPLPHVGIQLHQQSETPKEPNMNLNLLTKKMSRFFFFFCLSQKEE